VNRTKFVRFILRLLFPFLWQSLLAIFLGCITVLSGMGLIATSMYLISYAALKPSISELQVAIIGVRFFGLSRSIFRYLERISSHSTNLSMVSGLRVWFFERIEGLVPVITSSMQSGDITTRLMQDIEVLDQFFIRVISPPLIAMVVILIISLFINTIDNRLGWITFFSMTGMGLFIFLASTISHKKILSNFSSKRGKLYILMTNLVEGIADIRINGKADIFRYLYDHGVNDFTRVQNKSNATNAFLNALIPLTSGLGMLIVYIAAAQSAQNQIIDPKLIGVTALLVMAGYEIFQSFPQLGFNLVRSEQAISRLFEIVDQVPDIIDPDNPQSVDHFYSLDINRLGFHYPGSNKLILDGFSLQLEVGKKVALVGPSGAGKTSLKNILLRFWEYSSGSININGIDLRQLSQVNIRNLIRTSSQKPYFFPLSIQENLRFARPDSTMEELAEALYASQCMDWLSVLPSGLDTLIGNRGMLLSEGQRQRLDIARTLISGSDLLILDEPFAGIDTITERNLNRSVLKFTQDKTLLLITHHLTGLDLFDEILFLKDGKIIEKGSHDELISLSGEYSHMYKMQKSIFK
jgi:ATP-binding cassette, subfamily C, bacterial CydC